MFLKSQQKCFQSMWNCEWVICDTDCKKCCDCSGEISIFPRLLSTTTIIQACKTVIGETKNATMWTVSSITPPAPVDWSNMPIFLLCWTPTNGCICILHYADELSEFVLQLHGWRLQKCCFMFSSAQCVTEHDIAIVCLSVRTTMTNCKEGYHKIS